MNINKLKVAHLLAGAAVLFGACKGDPGSPTDESSVAQEALIAGSSPMCGGPVCFDLAQGAKNKDVGQVCVSNDADNVYIEYTADGPCKLTEVHVCVDTQDFPWTAPGQCPYKAEFPQSPKSTYTVTVPLSDLGATCDEALLYIQAHAALSCGGGGETAYGGTFKGKITYEPECCNLCDPATTDDHNACTTDVCDPATGIVTHTSIPVNDNNACTTDSCNPLTGPVHTPISVDDHNACTTDSCNPLTGPVHTPISVDDNNKCTADYCDPATGNVSHNPIPVDDGNKCTVDCCDPVTGVSHTPVNIDDYNPCTIDSCDPVKGVCHTPIPYCQ